MFWRCNLKEIRDHEAVAGDSIARQYCMVVCKMTLEARKRKRERTKAKDQTVLCEIQGDGKSDPGWPQRCAGWLGNHCISGEEVR